jgi:hypothetical protein
MQEAQICLTDNVAVLLAGRAPRGIVPDGCVQVQALSWARQRDAI